MTLQSLSLRSIFVGLALILAIAACKSSAKSNGAKDTPKGQTVAVKVSETRSYCGGAAPDEAMLEELRKPYPKVDFEVLIRPGEVNDLEKEAVSARTGESGEVRFDLKPGNYCLILPVKRNKLNADDFEGEFLQVDPECCADWETKCELSFLVKADGSTEPADLELKLHKRCHLDTYNPCVIWDGPIPPSAPGGGGH